MLQHVHSCPSWSHVILLSEISRFYIKVCFHVHLIIYQLKRAHTPQIQKIWFTKIKLQ